MCIFVTELSHNLKIHKQIYADDYSNGSFFGSLDSVKEEQKNGFPGFLYLNE